MTPLPVPRDARGVVVFGGTFDPVHRWHVRIAAAVRRRVFPRGGWIVFVPAARSPLKDGGPVASDADRVAMLRLATRRLARAVVWTDEIDRAAGGRPSYTVETLGRMRRVLGRAPLRLLIGADQAAQFHRWREYRRILALAEPVVVLRPPVRSKSALRRALERSGAWSAAEVEEWLGRVVPVEVRDISSSAIRAALGRGGDGRVRRAVPPAVAAYIRERGLYAPGGVAAARGRRRAT